jgi:hypothetical protein
MEKGDEIMLEHVVSFTQDLTTENVITAVALLIAFFSFLSARRAARASDRSANVAEEQLKVLTRRVSMVDEPGKMSEVLPVWFVERMSNDYWNFGLIMEGGFVFPVRQIISISDDRRWLEVEVMEAGDDIHNFPNSPVEGMHLIYALEGRTTANIQITKMIGALDLANT